MNSIKIGFILPLKLTFHHARMFWFQLFISNVSVEIDLTQKSGHFFQSEDQMIV